MIDLLERTAPARPLGHTVERWLADMSRSRPSGRCKVRSPASSYQGVGPAVAAIPFRVIDVNDRIGRLSTLLTILAGANQRLELDLVEGPLRVRCRPESLEMALLEAVSELRHQLAQAGTIVIRTRRLRHTMLLLAQAREDGAAAFRFGSSRSAATRRGTPHRAAATRLARECHGVARWRGAALLSLRLPTVLMLVAGEPATPRASLPHPQDMEMEHEDRQPVAA